MEHLALVGADGSSKPVLVKAAAVLDRLRVDSATEYDPAVVEALGRVLDRGVPRNP